MLNRVFILSVLVVLASCGPKKGIVTKKSKSKSATETVVNQTEDRPIAPVVEDEPKQPIQVAEADKLSTTERYIVSYADVAMDEMRRHKIPASITLAQGILESGSGRGRLAVEANNHFGIKCHGWAGQKIYHDDDRSQECFRKYREAGSSYEDHSEFLTGRSRYSKLFELGSDDYRGWAKGLKAAGYATDPRYPNKLIDLIERYELWKYDNEVLGKVALGSGKTPEIRLEYIVKKGDTLYSLSKKFGLTVDELKALNNLRSNDLSVGQVLRVNSN